MNKLVQIPREKESRAVITGLTLLLLAIAFFFVLEMLSA